MTDISPRRRLLGRLLLAGGLLALPLTASISYAEGNQAPAAPLVELVPAAPVAPAAPAAPLLLQAAGEIAAEAPEGGERVERKVIVIKRKDGESVSQRAPGVSLDENRRIIILDGKGLSEEERARLHAELDGKMLKMEGDLAEARKDRRIAMIEMRRSVGEEMSRIDVDCKDAAGQGGWQEKDGRKVMVLCRTNVTASALSGLREARKALARDQNLTGEVRAEVLKALDDQIAKMSAPE